MELFLILIGVWFLYSRTWLGKNRHYYIIDDNVRRWGYLYVVPQSSPQPSFYSTQPHPWRHFFLVVMHSLNVLVINLLFGWQVALLFAFSPISVNGTAWITGGYYAVTMFLSLTAYYFVATFPNLFGAVVGSLFFTAALGSTITCIGIPIFFIAVALLTGQYWGLAFFWPLGFYVFGKRFRTGFNVRNADKRDPITLRKLAVMAKVMAYYIRINLFPNKLAFFRKFGHDYGKSPEAKEKMERFDGLFWSSLGFIGFFTFVGWQFSPLGALWFLITLAPFTQFKILGQFIAERYLYLPQLGIYMILAGMIGDNITLLAIIGTLYTYRSHLYIPAFRNITSLYKNGISNYPDCMSNYANLGERYLHVGQTHRARRLLEEGLRVKPDNFLCLTNLAAYWISVHGHEQALWYTEKALAGGEGAFAKRMLTQQHTELVSFIKKKEENKKKEEAENVAIRERDTATQEEAVAGAV